MPRGPLINETLLLEAALRLISGPRRGRLSLVMAAIRPSVEPDRVDRADAASNLRRKLLDEGEMVAKELVVQIEGVD